MDAPITTATYNEILARCPLTVDLARLKALTISHAGDLLQITSKTLLSLQLSDEVIQMATSFRLGMYVNRTCVCGAMVDARGLQSLA